MEEEIRNLRKRAIGLSLEAVMPLWISVYHMRGGPSDNDFSWAEEIIEIALGESAPSDLWLDRKMFNLLAKSVAVLSFKDGGVSAFGYTFNAREIVWSLRNH